MSWLSKQTSSLAEWTKNAITKPIAKNYNQNKSAYLDAAAMAALAAAAAGTGGGALAAGGGLGFAPGAAVAGGILGATGGALMGSDTDKARKENQDAINKKQQAENELKNVVLPGISQPITNNPYPTTPATPVTPVVMNPTTGQPIPITDPSAKDLISGGQIPIDPSTGQPVLTSTSPGTTGQNTAITGNAPTSGGAVPVNQGSSDIQYTLGQTDPKLAGRLESILGTGTDQATLSAKQVANANDLAAQLSTQTLNTQAADRKQQIADLSTLLTQQADTQYQRSLPGLYEDLNTRGLLRSSELGNQMATKEQQSYQDVANQLAQTQLGYNDQYISGLGDITSQYNSGIGSAVQREQSLQDYVNQVEASLKLGQAVTPVASNSKSNSALASNAMGKTASTKQLANAFTKKP